MARFRIAPPALCLVFLCSLSPSASAVQPSELLLPATTKGFLSTHDVDEVRKKFNETQLGDLVHDPAMEPFIEDLKRQIRQRLERTGQKLGLDWNDLEGVYGGEVALALVQPNPKDRTSHATVLLVDVTGKQQQVDQLLAKIDANQRNNGAVKSNQRAGDVTLTVYTQRLLQGQREPERAYYFIKGDQLVATDDLNTAAAIAGRFDGKARDTLADVPAFAYAMERNKKEAADVRHHLRWFVEPFGYAEASRAANGGRRKRGTDMIKILAGQGFPAVQGAGGFVFFATSGVEMLHRTYVYAPPVPRKADDPRKEKYDLAMRMLDFPNSVAARDLEPQPWAMPDVATYTTFNWRMKEAFTYSETLVDAIAGEKGLFADIWEGMKSDPHGPKIDIYKGLVDHLGTRATVMTDVIVPVGLKSERLMALVHVNNPAVVAATVQKAFEKDPAAKKRVFEGQIIWEITQEEGLTESGAEDTELQIEGAGFVSTPETQVAQQRRRAAPAQADKPLPNMAIAVFQNHLIVATHVRFVEELITNAAAGQGLAAENDFQRVDKELVRLGSGNDSFRSFSRTSESYRATYELLRQNKLPQSETLLARLLNATPEHEDAGPNRRQEIDGSKLPPFDQVEKYLGPAGLYVQSEENGWLVVGCLLRTAGGPEVQPAVQPTANRDSAAPVPEADSPVRE